MQFDCVSVEFLESRFEVVVVVVAGATKSKTGARRGALFTVKSVFKLIVFLKRVDLADALAYTGTVEIFKFG